MDYKSAKQYIRKDRPLPPKQVKITVTGQCKHLLSTFDDSKDVQAIKDELLGAINSMKVSSPKVIKQSAILLFKYIYYECSNKAGHLIYNYAYISKQLTHHHYNMFNVAHNLIIKHFGIGTQHEALDVHASGHPGNMRIVITYI